MSYNGSGTFNINTAGQPVVTGTTITSTAFNALTADLASGLTTAMTKDGQTTPTANIPMGTFKITGLGAGTAATDAAQFGQLQAGATQIATVTGTDTLAGTLTPAPTAYAAGNLFSFVAVNTNTGAATINLNSLGAKSITKLGSTALAAGDIVSGRVYLIEYDGTRFQLINPSASSVASFSAGTTGFTPSTATTGAVTLAGTLATTNGGTGLTSFTANGVVYASSSSALTTGSALTFDGTNLGVGGAVYGGSTITARYTTPASGASQAMFGSTDGTKGFQLNQTGSAYSYAGVGGSELWYYANGSYSAMTFGSDGNVPIKWVTNGSEQMRLTSTGLGIGTSSPAGKLQVVSSASAGLLIGFNNTSYNYYDANNHIFRAGGGSTYATLDSSGNLGLGVTPSAWNTSYKALDVSAWGSVVGEFGVQGTITVVSNAYATSAGYDSWVYKNTAPATRYKQYNGAHSWFNAPSGTAGNAISFTQAMSLDASGNLGLGTTSPSTTLTIKTANNVGTQIFKTADTTSSMLAIYDSQAAGNASYTLLGTDATGATTGFSSGGTFLSVGRNGTGTVRDLIIHNYDAANIKFATNNTERARIDSSGNLLVGTTNVAENAGVGVKLLPSGYVYAVSAASTNTQDGYAMYSTGAAAYRFYVGWNGQINATSITISAISDQRLKENVCNLETGLDAIMALKPRRFDWKKGKGQDKKNVAGFIAQEFEEVFPECIGVTKAGEDGIEYKNINHETLIPTLVKAIQEQQALIESLTTRLATAGI